MIQTRSHMIDLGGLPFQYLETGEPSQPPLVALHALGRSAIDWEDIATALADDYCILALDQRGHGQSARPGTYSFELMRDDLLRFADALELETFVLIGHSLGGSVAYLFAELWPERLECLIIEDTSPPSGRRKFELPPDPSEPVPFDWRLMPRLIEQLNEPDPAWWERLNEISVPTLIVGGGPTSTADQDELCEVARSIPDCRLVTIDGAGHYVHGSNPDAFLDVVREFLQMELQM